MSATPIPNAETAARLVRGQRLMLALMVSGYAGYYLCRSNLSVCLPMIVEELGDRGIDASDAKIKLGAVVSLGTLGYAVGKFASGALADSFGGRLNFLAGMLGAVACTLLFAVGGGLPIFTLAWVGNRLLQSLGWVGMIRVASRWFGYSAYGTVMGIVSLSYLFGDAAARFFMGFLIENGMGWRGVFIVDAFILLGLFGLCLRFFRESPTEVGLLEPEPNPSNLFADEAESPTPLGLVAGLMSDPGFLAVCVLSLGFTLLRETFNTWTPTYFVEALGLTKDAAATRSALFPLLGGVSVLVAGAVSDRLGKVGRALMIAVGLVSVGATLAVLGSANFGGSAAVPVTLVALAAFLMIGPYSFLAGAVALDFGGKRGSATASGLIDGIGYLGGILAGESMARISARFGWHGAFLVLAGTAWASSLAAFYFLIHQKKSRSRERTPAELA